MLHSRGIRPQNKIWKNSNTRKEYEGIFGLSEMIKYLIISIAEGEVVQVSGINQIYKNIMEESFPQIKKKRQAYTQNAK